MSLKTARNGSRKWKKAALLSWWIPAGHVPTVAEGRQRLEHYQFAWPHAAFLLVFQVFPQPEGDAIAV